MPPLPHARDVSVAERDAFWIHEVEKERHANQQQFRAQENVIQSPHTNLINRDFEAKVYALEQELQTTRFQADAFQMHLEESAKKLNEAERKLLSHTLLSEELSRTRRELEEVLSQNAKLLASHEKLEGELVLKPENLDALKLQLQHEEINKPDKEQELKDLAERLQAAFLELQVERSARSALELQVQLGMNNGQEESGDKQRKSG